MCVCMFPPPPPAIVLHPPPRLTTPGVCMCCLCSCICVFTCVYVFACFFLLQQTAGARQVEAGAQASWATSLFRAGAARQRVVLTS